MSDLSLIPLQDGYESQLSQDWDGNTGTIYVLATPSYTPTTTNTYIVVDPGKTNMQIAEITSYDSTAKTLTVSSISFEKGLGISSTAQSHSTGSKVIISDNYQFWEDIQTAVNSKVDGNSDDVGVYKFADATARDAFLTSPTNGQQAYLTTEGYWTDYVGGAWVQRATGAVSNASATVAGKVEIATSAESIAGTDTGGTGALLSVLPSDLAKNTQSGTFVYGTDVGGDDTYVVALTPVLAAYTAGQTLYFKPTTANTGACSVNFGPGVLNIKTKDGNDPQTGVLRALTEVSGHYDGTSFVIDNEDFATTANKGIVEMATDAEALAGVDTTRYINAAQLEAHSLMNAGVITNYSGLTNVTTDTTVTLTFQPRIIKLNFWLQGHDASTSNNKYYGSGGTAVYEGTTLKYTNYTASQSMLSGDNGAFDTTFSNVAGTLIKNVNGTSAPVAGTGGANAAEKLVTLTVNSVSATGFVIRVVTTGGDGASSTGRANISWEAFQ